jgi:xanthosine utilization system XapX-like protein
MRLKNYIPIVAGIAFGFVAALLNISRTDGLGIILIVLIYLLGERLIIISKSLYQIERQLRLFRCHEETDPLFKAIESNKNLVALAAKDKKKAQKLLSETLEVSEFYASYLLDEVQDKVLCEKIARILPATTK